MTLAKYWVAKHQHFMQMWLDAGSVFPFTYSDSDIASFKDTDEFKELWNNRVSMGKACARIADMKELKPVGRGRF